ncbi:MAG: site-specific integrase [Candidatus Methanomethylicia archaeon]
MESYYSLLRFKSVSRMVNDLKLLTRSVETEKAYLKGLWKFMRVYGINDLDEYVEDIRRSGSVDEVYKSWITYLSSTGLAPKTVSVWSSALRKFFDSNNIEVKRRVRIKTFVINESALPSRDDLRRILNKCSLRTKTAILILASSGLRVGELLNLKIGDIDLESNPAMIMVKALKTKERKSRVTFMSDEAREILREYIEERRRREMISDDSPVIACSDGSSMTLQNLNFLLRNAFKTFSRKNGKYYSLHPHVLRKWFKTQLIASGVPGPIADRLCGHSRYLAEEYELYTVDQLRKWYLKAMPNLTLMSKPLDNENIRKQIALEAIRRFAEAFGIDPLKIRIEREKELNRELTVDEEIQLITNMMKKMREGSDPKIVKEDELEKYLTNGWDVQTILPSGRILIRRRNIIP